MIPVILAVMIAIESPDWCSLHYNATPSDSVTIVLKTEFARDDLAAVVRVNPNGHHIVVIRRSLATSETIDFLIEALRAGSRGSRQNAQQDLLFSLMTLQSARPRSGGIGASVLQALQRSTPRTDGKMGRVQSVAIALY